MVTNPFHLQSLTKLAKDEMDAAKADCRAAQDAERLHQEAHQCANVCQEGALGALPRGYGIAAPRVAGPRRSSSTKISMTNLLVQNSRLQNNLFLPFHRH